VNSEKFELRNESGTSAPRKLRLLPEDPLGQRLCEIFTNGWQFIYAPAPTFGEKPQWQTETRYPLEPRNLWRQWQNPEQLIGVRPGKETTYALIDIDRGSPYHPDNDAAAYGQVLAVLESIGFCRVIVLRSSFSGGRHLYLPLPEPMPSYALALTLKHAFQQEGLEVSQGKLETFPNTKAYKKKGYTNYNAHRLPLQPQSGSMLLDEGGGERGDRFSDFIQQWDIAAACNDMEQIREAATVAREQNKVVRMGDRRTHKAEQWYQDDLAIIQQGWTGPGQTNELLKVFARFGIVWKGLGGEELVNYVVETAKSAPGYQDYCHHKHELDRRAAEWAAAAEGYYTPYCSFPNRITDLHQHECSLDRDQNVLPFNDERAEQARQRIRNAVAALEADGTLPVGIDARAKLLCREAQCSRRTLYKNLSLWHPHHYGLAPAEQQDELLQDGTAEPESISAEFSEFSEGPQNQPDSGTTELPEDSVPTSDIRRWGTPVDLPVFNTRFLPIPLPSRLHGIDYSTTEENLGLDLSDRIAAIQILQRLLQWTTQQLQEWLLHVFSVRSLALLDDDQLVLCSERLHGLCAELCSASS